MADEMNVKGTEDRTAADPDKPEKNESDAQEVPEAGRAEDEAPSVDEGNEMQDPEFLLQALQRKEAELQNLRKRHRKQMDDQRDYGQSKILEDFAGVFSDLHLALVHAEGDEGSGEVIEGVQLVHDKFEALLKKYGVEAYGEAGDAFNPEIHEALMRQDDPSKPRNTILQVFQRGYRIKDRVLKPAGVVVSAGGPPREATTSETSSES